MRTEALDMTSIGTSRLFTMESKRHSPNQIIHSLAAGDMAVLDQIYDLYRDDFIRWAGNRFQVKQRDDLLDAWHDTMIMFYEQIRDRKLTHLTCEVKSYLFTIGSRRLMKMHQKSLKTDLVEEFDANINIDQSINVSEEEEIEKDKQKILMEAVKTLPDKSRQILTMRYIDGKSIPQIMQELGYASENAVSVTLSRGLKTLKERIHERLDIKRV